MPSTNTAGWLARRADEMPREAAVAASIIATCCLVSFSYVLSGEPAASFRPIAWTAPGEAASRLTFWEAVAESASEPVKFAPGGSVTGHQTPAATTPLMWSATASAPAGKPIGGLVLGAATLLAGPLSSTVNVVSSRTVNWREIWPAPVAVRPSTATNAPTPRIVPSMVSTALPGRCTMPDPGQSREPVGVLGLHAVQDNGQVAAPLAGRALAGDGHRPGHAEQGESDVGDGQVGPDLAAVLSPGQQAGQQVAESLPPVRADSQERADGLVAGAVGQHVFQETHQAVPGIRVGQRGLGDGLPAAVPVLEQLIDELFLGEVTVQRGIADPGAPGDLDQADAEPLVGESLRGGGEDPVPVLPGIAALAAHRSGWRDNHDPNSS